MSRVNMPASIEANGHANRKAACQDCDWEGKASECKEIADYEDRVGAGEDVPCGECPECGALAHIIEPVSIGDAREGLARSLESYVSEDDAAEFFHMHQTPGSDFESWRKPFLRRVAERILDDLK